MGGGWGSICSGDAATRRGSRGFHSRTGARIGHDSSPPSRNAQPVRASVGRWHWLSPNRGSDLGKLLSVKAHGLSTVEDDSVEARAIRDVLPSVPVTAPKSYFGNLGAAGGAVEMAITVQGFPSRPRPSYAQFLSIRSSLSRRSPSRVPDPQNRPFSSINWTTSGQNAALLMRGIEKRQTVRELTIKAPFSRLYTLEAVDFPSASGRSDEYCRRPSSAHSHCGGFHSPHRERKTTLTSWIARSRGWISLVLLTPVAIGQAFSPLWCSPNSWGCFWIDCLGWSLFICGGAMRWWATLYIGGRKSVD